LDSICVIQKIFPYGELNQGMKLTKNKLLETLRRKNVALIECNNPTTDKSIEGMEESLRKNH
jgi:molecular chaperone GrpE (heat shock protein)